MTLTLPPHWKLVTVDDIKASTDTAIAIGPFGSRMKADLYVASGVPVIRGTNISAGRTFSGDFVYVAAKTADSIPACNVFGGDLVFPHRGAIGEVGIVPHDGIRYMLSTSLMKLTCNPNLANPQFLFYFFRSPAGRHELLKNASTVGTPGIGQPLTSLRSIRVPLPPRSEQDRIVAILGSLDDKIELNCQINRNLEAIARRLFKSWFVDFDPVRAKVHLRHQHPKWNNAKLSQHALPHIPATIAELFPDKLHDSAIGSVPDGWRVATVPDAIELNPSRSLPKRAMAPWLEMSNMPTDSARARAWEYREFGSGTKFINGDTLVARITPCLENGKTAFVDFLNDGEVGAGSTEYIVLRPKSPLPPCFAYLLARTEPFRQHLIANTTGTSGRQRAPATCLNSFPVTIPPSAIAEHFAHTVSPLFAQMKVNDEQSATLTQLRDKLLPRLLSGAIRLDDRMKPYA